MHSHWTPTQSQWRSLPRTLTWTEAFSEKAFFLSLLTSPSKPRIQILSTFFSYAISSFYRIRREDLLSGCLRTLLLVCNFLFFLLTKRERENTGQFHTFWMCHLTECESESQDTHSFQEQEKGSGLSAINLESRVQGTCVKHITTYHMPVSFESIIMGCPAN